MSAKQVLLYRPGPAVLHTGASIKNQIMSAIVSSYQIHHNHALALHYAQVYDGTYES